MKIKSKGNIKIFDNSYIRPNEIFINGIKQNNINPYYNLDKFDNEVKLIWNQKIGITTFMFLECDKINEIDLSNFDTSKVTDMMSMFNGCSSLTSLNLSNLDTSKVENLAHIFYNCPKLTSLDISNFNTNLITSSSCHIFYNCGNLKYLNLKKAKLNNQFIAEMKADLTLTGVALSDMNINLKREIFGSSSFTISCINNLYDKSNANYKFDCYFKSNINNNVCNYCGSDYYKKYNDSTNTNLLINCHKEIKNNYYIDYNDFLYKLCYLSCKECNISGNMTNHNCIECDDEYVFELDKNYYKNCYKICDYFFYYDINNNKSYCTPELECPENYSYLIPAKNECISNCTNDLIYKYEYNKKYYNKCPKYTLERSLYFCDDIKNLDEYIIYMRQFFINEINLTYIKEENDYEEKRENILVTITTTDNQKKENINKDKTTFDLGECEDELKDYYNISYNDTLYIFKIDVSIQGMKIPKIFYEIYYPLYNDTPQLLNLSICKNKNIDLIIPFSLNDTIEKYNSSSDYYNNICTKANSESNTDILLKDRQEDFINNNLTVCEEKCKFVDYNYTKKKAKCSCEIKLNLPIIDEIKFNTDELYDSFTDIKNLLNLNLMKCFKILFILANIIKNFGFFIILFILILFFICLIIFYFRYKSLIKTIDDIILAKEEQSKNNKIFNKKETKSNQKNKPRINNDLDLNSNTRSKNYKKRKIKNKFFPKKHHNKNKNNFNLSDINNYTVNKKQSKKNINIDNNKNQKNSGEITSNTKDKKPNEQKYKEILEKDDTEMNTLTYEQALQKDKRTFLQYYISLLRVGHLLIFSFYNNRDYNSRIIKMYLFSSILVFISQLMLFFLTMKQCIKFI